MKTNYLEKRKMISKIILTIILLPFVLWVFNYFFNFLIGESMDLPPLNFFAILASVAINCMIIYLFWLNLDIEIPKRKKSDELIKLEEFFDQKKDQAYNKASDSVEKTNKKCPICGNKEKNVSKIREVSGKISGNFNLGYGSVSGSVGTGSVNHCSACGNEWKNIAVGNYVEEAMEEFLSPMYDFFYSSIEADDYLKKFSARTLKKFLSEHNSSSYGDKAEKLSKLYVWEIKKYIKE